MALLVSVRRGVLGLSVALAACGGGTPAEPPADAARAQVQAASAKVSRADAARFLVQASFGPSEAEIDRVVALGYRGWIDDQLRTRAYGHAAVWDAAEAASPRRGDPVSAVYQVLDGFYTQAVTGSDQLRGRVAYALSEIFVISLRNDAVWDHPRGAASYLDMLGREGLTTYRRLIEGVARHPMMGVYLSHLHNQKESGQTGRVPDQNFARELMQLFSIGLVALERDGTPRLDRAGRPIPTYGGDDIAGLARVFTGWSWAGPDTGADRFWGLDDRFRTQERGSRPMQAYAQFHSMREKRFLGTVIAAGTGPEASLKRALDTIAAHPNVGPFLAQRLIQRLVTSNPSRGYIERVARVFDDNGSGVRGDMKAVIAAVLLDREARSAEAAAEPAYGKLREPVLRLTALLRAFPSRSDSGRWMVRVSDGVTWGLAQMPLGAPSVFNYFRPGYVAPNSRSGKAGRVAPELQIVNETSVAGYANYMVSALFDGVGARGADGRAPRNDVQIDLAAEAALAHRPERLARRITGRLLGSRPVPALDAEIEAAVASIPLPADTGANGADVAAARLKRARAALAIALVAPEFLVQK